MRYLENCALSVFGPRRRGLTVLSVVLVTLYAMAPGFARASPPSAAMARALENISATRPCTASALLHVIRRSDSTSSGTFYLPDYPTPAAIAFLIGLEDGGADFQAQPNLYADVSYYIEVRWSVERLNRQVVMVSAEAQLVSAAGLQLDPVHPIEPLTRVLMVGQSLRLLPSAVVD